MPKCICRSFEIRMLHSNYSNNKAHCRWAGQIAHREQKSRFCSKKYLRIDLYFREFSFRNQDLKIVGQHRNLIFRNNLLTFVLLFFEKIRLNMA
jgi:hypothetical protein